MKTFIELGACDFDNLTPLLYSGWRGFFIEPISHYMESLISTIKKQQISQNAFFEYSAISNYDGEIEMVFASNPGEEWIKGISHINSRQNTSNLIHYNNFPSQVIKVPCLTLDSFLTKHNIHEIDLLKIDIEGHELVVLENYSWNIKPKIIKMEHKFVNREYAINFLYNQGYYCWEETDDLYCILK